MIKETTGLMDIKLNKELHKNRINTIIIGASAAGLACAASLKRKNIPYIILEKNAQVAGPWRAHYDRLHLNTEKWNSHLPYFCFPKTAAVYLSRDELVEYMEAYAARFDIRPVFNQHVESVTRSQNEWMVKTSDNRWFGEHIIIASGQNRHPYIPSWPGMQEFKGKVIHSSSYKNGQEYKDKNVLVVGFGNSACEIAICLHEHGAHPFISVKGAVNVVPREAGGVLVSRLLHRLAFVTRRFPECIDWLIAGRLKKRYGFLENHGLQKLPYGPNVQIIRHKRVPVLDIGTMSLIRSGIIKVFPGIQEFTRDGVLFTNGAKHSFDAVILATGFQPGIREFLAEAREVIDRDGRPLKSGRQSPIPGLFFCGFSVTPNGMLNQICREAKNIAREIQAITKNKISNR